MPAFLRKLFKSKQKTPVEQKPVEIENLDPKRVADREQLHRLIIDPAASERQINAALTKTGDLDIIVRWYVGAPKSAQVHIADWIGRQTTNARRLAQARGRLGDPQLQQILDQLSGALPDQASNSVASSLPQTPDQAERLAVEAKTSQQRQEAAAQVSDEAALQRIVKASKGRDKGVYQIARQKLQTLRAEAARIAATHADIEKLIEQCEAHARTESTQLYQPRFESLTQSWASVKAEATQEQQERFLNAQAVCQSRCNELAAESERAARAEARVQERAATLTLLQETLTQLKQAPPEQLPSVSSLDALQKTQENRWLEATRDSKVGSAEQKEYEQLMQGLRQYLQAIRAYESHREELRSALGGGSGETGRSTDLAMVLKAIAWPEGYPQPLDLNHAREYMASQSVAEKAPAPTRTVDTSDLQAQLDQLERTLEQKELRPSRKLLREAQQSAERLPERVRRPFQGRLTLLARQVQDLQDWHGFATRPKQEALCAQMEHLAEQHLEPELKAAKIHELQEQWRELGGSSDQALWQRFKQAADLAFAPCQDYFAARNELKAANLHKREQVCEELSMFIAQVDWSSCDWRGVEKIHRKARQEWRDAKPIDFRKNRDVQRRFDDLLKELDTRLDQERARNEASKAEIVAQAQALASHEPLGEAMAKAKELQKSWESIGITRQKQDRVLWQSFRAACDAIFARRDNQRAEQQAQSSEQLAAAETLLEQLERLLAADAAARDTQAIEQALERFRQLDLPASQRDGLNKRAQALQKQFEDSLRAAEREQQKVQWLNRLQASSQGTASAEALQELCIRAEILAGIDSPAEDQKKRMSLQVERLAAGLGQGQNFPDARTEMEHLVNLWADNPPSGPQPALVARMEAAIASLQA